MSAGEARGPEREGFVEIGGERTFYVERGEGPAIVLIHGWSLSVAYWRPVMDHFGPGYRLIAYDLPGMGRSSGGERPYQFKRLIDDLEAVRETFGLERPLICGHSLGGDVAAQYAVSFHGRAAGFALLDAPGRPNLLINPIVAFLLRIGLPLLAKLGVEQPLRVLVPLLRVLFFSRAFRRTHPGEIRAWRDQFLTSEVPAIVNALAAEAYRRVLALELHRVREPTLVVRGAKDLVVSQRQAESFARRIPDARLRVLPGAGHMTPVERPAEVARLVRELADSLPRSAYGRAGRTALAAASDAAGGPQ